MEEENELSFPKEIVHEIISYSDLKSGVNLIHAIYRYNIQRLVLDLCYSTLNITSPKFRSFLEKNDETHKEIISALIHLDSISKLNYTCFVKSTSCKNNIVKCIENHLLNNEFSSLCIIFFQYHCTLLLRILYKKYPKISHEVCSSRFVNNTFQEKLLFLCRIHDIVNIEKAIKTYTLWRKYHYGYVFVLIYEYIREIFSKKYRSLTDYNNNIIKIIKIFLDNAIHLEFIEKCFLYIKDSPKKYEIIEFLFCYNKESILKFCIKYESKEVIQYLLSKEVMTEKDKEFMLENEDIYHHTSILHLITDINDSRILVKIILGLQHRISTLEESHENLNKKYKKLKNKE